MWRLWHVGLIVVCVVLAGRDAAAEPATALRNPCGPGIFVRDRPDHAVVSAAFAARSSVPGATASLWVSARSSEVAVQLFRVGAGTELRGLAAQAVTSTQRVTMRAERQRVAVPISRESPSGLYVARVTTNGGVGYA